MLKASIEMVISRRSQVVKARSAALWTWRRPDRYRR